MPTRRRSEKVGRLPAGFRIRREIPIGRHPLLEAFPGLDQLATAKRLESDDGARRSLLEETCIELVADDIWMYVAPHELPKEDTGPWKPRVSKTDCIVVGESHLRESAALILFLDIFHELCHVRQRRAGRELFDRSQSYVRRPTEVEAYRFAVEEARRLGVADDVLRDYLKVEWVSDDELLELLRAVGVPPAA